MFEEAEELFSKAMKINPSFLIMIYDNIGTRYQKKGQFEKADEIINKASGLRRNYYNPTSQENYQELYNVVSKRGIKLIAMQYPTLDVDDLKKMFKGDEEIIFINNEENFDKALENATYEELFTDNSLGSFGHATLKGNRLIAENVAKAISDVKI